MVERINELFVDEDGATMVEYALLLGLIAVVCIVVIGTLGGKIKALFQSSSDQIPAPAG